MKIKNIGIPRYLYYSNYKSFIKNYFEYLGYNVILSRKEIGQLETKKRCKIYRTYLNHILYLKNKCDLVVVPYQNKITKLEEFCPIVENMNTIIKNIVSNIFTFNIQHPITIILSTLKINKNIPKIIISYILARIDYKKDIKRKNQQQYEEINTNTKHILIVTNSYYEYEISHKKNNKYNYIYSNYLKETTRLDYYENYSQKTDIYFIKLMIGSIYFCHNLVEKIIIININDCKYNLKQYLTHLEPQIKKKIAIINI